MQTVRPKPSFSGAYHCAADTQMNQLRRVQVFRSHRLLFSMAENYEEEEASSLVPRLSLKLDESLGTYMYV